MVAQIYFLPSVPQLTGPKGEPMGGGKTSPTNPCWELRLPGLQTGTVFSMKGTAVAAMVDGTNVIWAEHLPPLPQHVGTESGAICPHQNFGTWGWLEINARVTGTPLD